MEYPYEMRSMQPASITDIGKSMREQLMILVEWAKKMPWFLQNLDLDDQVALLRAHAGEHLLLGVARRSMKLKDFLLLGNNMIIPRDNWNNDSKDEEVRNIGVRIMNELVEPFREIDIDDEEFACLKAIVFFDPNIHGLTKIREVRNARKQVQINLEDYIGDNKQYDPRGKFGSLLLILPSLQSISLQMIQQINIAKHSGITEIDSLLQEMLLGGPSMLTGDNSEPSSLVLNQHLQTLNQDIMTSPPPGHRPAFYSLNF